MDERILAKHGQFARELEELQRLGVPAEPKPDPEGSAVAAMAFAAVQVAWGGVILVSVALQQLFGLDILRFKKGAVAIVVVPVLVVAAMKSFEAWRPALPEPSLLRGVSDKALGRWRGVSWIVALASFMLLLTWTRWDSAVPLLVAAKESGDLGLPVTAGLAFLAAAGAWIPLILCQIAVDARQRGR